MNPIDLLITVPLPPLLVERIQAVSSRLRINLIPTRDAEAIAVDKWQNTEILYTDFVLPDLGKINRLRWIQSHTTDLGFIQQSPLGKNEMIVITNMSGIESHAVAEYVVMMMLVLTRQFFSSRVRDTAAPNRQGMPGQKWNLNGAVVGIIGYGSVGREVARLLQPFGMTILATKRDVMDPTDSGYFIPGMGDPKGDLFHRLYPPQAIKSMVKECDFVVVCLPSCPSTKGLIGASMIHLMKPTSFYIHVSQPDVVDIQAFTDAIVERRIRGAAFDIQIPSSLSADHPLFKSPEIILTPRIAGETEDYMDKAIELFIENLRRYLEGLPLLNQYHPIRGY
mgnify:CR=1 FL=1